jgi:hypothetical protein
MAECKDGNTIWGTTKGWELLEQERYYQLPKEDSTAWR